MWVREEQRPGSSAVRVVQHVTGPMTKMVLLPKGSITVKVRASHSSFFGAHYRHAASGGLVRQR